MTDINECVNKQYSEIECYRRLKTSRQDIKWNLHKYERYFIQLCERYRKSESAKWTNVSNKVKAIEEGIRCLDEVLETNQEIKEKSKIIKKIRYAFWKLEWLQRIINYDDFEILYLWKWKWTASKLKRDFRQGKLTVVWLLLFPVIVIVGWWRYFEPLNWLFETMKGK